MSAIRQETRTQVPPNQIFNAFSRLRGYLLNYKVANLIATQSVVARAAL